MDELQTIREAIKHLAAISAEVWQDGDKNKATSALAALSRLEDRALEMPDAIKIAAKAMGTGGIGSDRQIEALRELAAEIGQYAYRYSEDIRKDRDYWQKIAMAFHDAVHQHLENHKAEYSECQKCESQGIDCAESCLRPIK